MCENQALQSVPFQGGEGPLSLGGDARDRDSPDAVALTHPCLWPSGELPSEAPASRGRGHGH